MARIQVAMTSPISSNPVLQEYVAVSPTELPADVTSPLLGLLGFEHRANKQTIKQLSQSTISYFVYTTILCWTQNRNVIQKQPNDAESMVF